MSETDQFIGQKQDTLIWEGLQTLRELRDWMMAARDPDFICAAFSQAIPACESMRALWNSPLSSSPIMKIAKPLAYDSEMRVMLQRTTRQERTLKELTVMVVKEGKTEAFDELTDAKCKTAKGLPKLHRSDVESGTVYGWENLEHFLPAYKILKLQ